MQLNNGEEIKKNGYLSLIKEKNYILQTIATIISRFGDGIDTIAFSLLVYEITGSTLLVATLFGINGIPNLIFGMISGVVCKYVTDKKIMAICDFGRFACVSMIALLYISGNLAVWHLYVITFINSSFESFRGPAATSILPKLIPMEKIEHGMALSSTGSKTAELAGLAIAPFIISVFGLGAAVLIDGITFLLCGLLVMAIKLKDSVVANEALTVKKYFIDLKEGFSYIKNDNLIINIVVFAAVINALVVPFNSLQAPYVNEVLKTSSGALSVMSICLLAGMTIATIFAPSIKGKLGNRKMFIYGGVIIGITYTIMALLGNLDEKLIYVALGVDTFVFGVGALLVNFPLQMIMFKKVPREYLARVAATFNAVALCSVPVTAFVIGIISEFVSIEKLFMVFGIVIAVLFLMQSMSKVVRKYDEA
ncbi:MAG: MFS transporter [Clostridium sp.]